MNRQTISKFFCGLLFTAYIIYYFAGIPLVPFHPDETTQIFTSSDVRTLFTHPSDLFFDSTNTGDLHQHYRLIDAPLTRTMIGLLQGFIPPADRLTTDWNWSAGWNENKAAGAIPTKINLFVSRLACAILVPLALLAFYDMSRFFTNRWIAILFTALLGLNPQVLLHTRRAMAEGWLFSLTCLLLWTVITPSKKWKTFLAIVLFGLIFQAKQTALPLMAIAATAMLYKAFQSGRWKTGLKTLALLGLSIGLWFYCLNPVAWVDPVQTARRMAAERLDFSHQQSLAYQQNQGGQSLPTAGLRATGILAQVYFAPPAYFDTGNYASELKPSIQIYQQNPARVLFSGWAWGSLMLVLTMLGISYSLYMIIHNQSRYELAVVLGLFLTLVIFFTVFITIGFQRYYILYLPLVYLLGSLPFRNLPQIPIRADNAG